jgi:hypothetical protein
LLEAEVVKLLAHGFRELRNYFAAFGGKVFARAQQFRIQLLQFAVEPGQFAIAAFKLRQPAFRVVAKRNDLGQCRAVFALERVEEIQPFFEQLQLRRVNVHLLRVARKFRLQLAQR